MSIFRITYFSEFRYLQDILWYSFTFPFST